MTATGYQRLAKARAKKREAGLVKVEVWVPDTDEAREEIRKHAAELCDCTTPKDVL